MNALGLRIKSGFAIGILASGAERTWTIVSRHDVPLTDGTGEYARFPFHPLREVVGRELDRHIVKPWRADEKLAALAAYWRLREH